MSKRFKCFADDCDNEVEYQSTYCSGNCKYPDYKLKYWELFKKYKELQKLLEL